ncbi:hypothetical protein [Nocardia sp. NPDC047038]|uniref:hypothetical protein n=1 Tax=Nocardia sp. NPDC047038 TaxID=3154338 RepID=UPI0033F81208
MLPGHSPDTAEIANLHHWWFVWQYSPAMANFPAGKFTITNNDTGRSVLAVLGKTTAHHDYQLGNTYTTYTTGDPTLTLGIRGTIESTWKFDTSGSQIISVAVNEKNNIGDCCVAIRQDDAADRGAWVELLRPPEWTGEPDLWPDIFMQVYRLLPLDEDADACEQLAQQNLDKGWTGDWDSLINAVTQIVSTVEDSGKKVPPAAWADCPISLDRATGQGRDVDAWQTDGTYIWSADTGRAPEPARTYWTDAGGTLVGRGKGKPHQTWTFASA